jgi:hypothetical protein
MLIRIKTDDIRATCRLYERAKAHKSLIRKPLARRPVWNIMFTQEGKCENICELASFGSG